MRKYTDVEAVELPVGKTVMVVNDVVWVEEECIYSESWMRNVSVTKRTR